MLKWPFWAFYEIFFRFQKDAKKGVGKSDEIWGLKIDIASDNYFKCLKIP